MKCDNAGVLTLVKKVASGEWTDYPLTLDNGNGLLRTYTNKYIIDILNQSIGTQKDEVNRQKFYHPLMGYTWYPELCEKGAQYYLEWQKELYPEQFKPVVVECEIQTEVVIEEV